MMFTIFFFFWLLYINFGLFIDGESSYQSNYGDINSALVRNIVFRVYFEMPRNMMSTSFD